MAPRPDSTDRFNRAADHSDTRRDRDALRRERMAAPLDFRSAPGPARGHQPRRSTLTALGVFLVVTVPSALAAAADSLLTGTVHWIFGIVFVAASFHAATLVRRRDLLAAVIVPPIAYSVGLLTAVQFGVLTAGGGFLGQVASTGALLALKPRPLFLGTGLAAALIAARWAGGRSAKGAGARR